MNSQYKYFIMLLIPLNINSIFNGFNSAREFYFKLSVGLIVPIVLLFFSIHDMRKTLIIEVIALLVLIILYILAIIFGTVIIEIF